MTEEKIQTGTLELDMINAPIPRGKGWSYTLEFCGHELFRAKSYKHLIDTHLVREHFLIKSGEHLLTVAARKSKKKWDCKIHVNVSKPEIDPNYVLAVDVKDSIRDPNSAKIESGAKNRFKIISMTGSVEYIVFDNGSKSPPKSIAAKKGMNLQPKGWLVIGPNSNLTVECLNDKNTERVLIRPMSIMRVDEINTSKSIRDPDVDLNIKNHMFVQSLSIDGGPKPACTVRG